MPAYLVHRRVIIDQPLAISHWPSLIRPACSWLICMAGPRTTIYHPPPCRVVKPLPSRTTGARAALPLRPPHPHPAWCLSCACAACLPADIRLLRMQALRSPVGLFAYSPGATVVIKRSANVQKVRGLYSAVQCWR